MSKEYTAYIKGIAILMMVWLHLFKPTDDVFSLGYLLSIGDTPVISILTRMCQPVSFFLILSGYGLYAVFSRLGGVNSLKRTINLYLHLWIIYAILIPIASYLRPEVYPGGWKDIIENAISWRCTYCAEQWFFFPYVLLMISSRWLFLLFDRIRFWGVFVVCAFIYVVTVASLKIIGEDVLSNNMLFYNVFLSLYMLFPFSLGYLAKRYSLMEKTDNFLTKWNLKKRWLVILLLFLLCVARCFTTHQAINPLYAFAFVLLFSQIPVVGFVGKSLNFLGKHSMNIWLIHTWICIRLFHEFVYGLHYPIVIFLFVLLSSISISLIVEFVYGFINKIINLNNLKI